MQKAAIQSTLFKILSLDAPSKQEAHVADYVEGQLQSIGFSDVHRDKKGNVIGFLEGEGEPILLNAHLDRVPPGKGHIPRVDGDIIRSDGTTNLGADDAAGITIILEALRLVQKEKKPHPPIVVAFTVEEEIGLFGAKALDVSKYNVQRGIVFDNAFEAGTVVFSGAAYVAFALEIRGKAAHPGKDLAAGVNAIEVFRQADVPLREADGGKTRINIGTLIAGSARNAVPETLTAQGEIRSFLGDKGLEGRVAKVRGAFVRSAEKLGATVVFTSTKLAVAYTVDAAEPLVTMYKRVVEERGGQFAMKETFVASDGNALRGEKGLKVFVISTGVVNEHSVDEQVNVQELQQLTDDLVSLLSLLVS